MTNTRTLVQNLVSNTLDFFRRKLKQNHTPIETKHTRAMALAVKPISIYQVQRCLKTLQKNI